MSYLTVYADQSHQTLLETSDPVQIEQALSALNARFERWQANKVLDQQAQSDDVLQAYKDDIDRLVANNGYQAVDVISLSPDHPKKTELREKFLHEHRHSDDEVRFFVEGSGLFVLHEQGKVFSLLCEKGDLISVPAGTRHWFDMGSQPHFVCIRLFNNPEGWVAQATGDDIAEKFPNLN